MIRKHYLTQIGSMINEHGRFKEADFWTTFEPREAARDAEIEEGVEDRETQYALEITYCYEPQYKFIATMRPSDEQTPRSIYTTVTASPGHLLVTETATNVPAHQLSDYIRGWLQRLDEELSSVPLQRQLEEQHREIESIFKQLDQIPKDFISRQEAEVLRGRLDDLEARLIQNLQETVADQEELENKIKAISDDMSTLKENMQALNKRGWAKSVVTRAFEWAKDPANRRVLKSGAELAKDLFLEAGDQAPK